MKYNWPKELELLQLLGLELGVIIIVGVPTLLNIYVLLGRPSHRAVRFTLILDIILAIAILFGVGFIK